MYVYFKMYVDVHFKHLIYIAVNFRGYKENVTCSFLLPTLLNKILGK